MRSGKLVPMRRLVRGSRLRRGVDLKHFAKPAHRGIRILKHEGEFGTFNLGVPIDEETSWQKN